MRFQKALLAAAILVLSIVGTSLAQDGSSRMAHANGAGTLKLGSEQFKINGVVIKLLDDGKTEITLIADITIFVTGTWAQSPSSQTDFDLSFTDASSRGGLDGAGKLSLNPDNTGMKLNLKGKSRATKRSVEVSFVGK